MFLRNLLNVCGTAGPVLSIAVALGITVFLVHHGKDKVAKSFCIMLGAGILWRLNPHQALSSRYYVGLLIPAIMLVAYGSKIAWESIRWKSSVKTIVAVGLIVLLAVEMTVSCYRLFFTHSAKDAQSMAQFGQEVSTELSQYAHPALFDLSGEFSRIVYMTNLQSEQFYSVEEKSAEQEILQNLILSDGGIIIHEHSEFLTALEKKLKNFLPNLEFAPVRKIFFKKTKPLYWLGYRTGGCQYWGNAQDNAEETGATVTALTLERKTPLLSEKELNAILRVQKWALHSLVTASPQDRLYVGENHSLCWDTQNGRAFQSPWFEIADEVFLLRIRFAGSSWKKITVIAYYEEAGTVKSCVAARFVAPAAPQMRTYQKTVRLPGVQRCQVIVIFEHPQGELQEISIHNEKTGVL